MASVNELCKDLEDKMDILRARQSRRDQFLAKTGSDGTVGELGVQLGTSEATFTGDAAVGEAVLTSLVPPLMTDQTLPSSPQRGVGGGGDNNKTGHGGQDIYLGNLPNGTTQAELMTHFAKFRPMRARVLNNSGDGHSYGFVRLPGMEEAKQAVQEFDGMETNGHQISVRICRDRSRARIMEEGVTRGLMVTDPNYAAMTVHIGNLDVLVTEEDIIKLFADYGGITQITLFATFDRKRKYSRVTLRSEALVEKAVTELRGKTLGKTTITVNRFGSNRPTGNAFGGMTGFAGATVFAKTCRTLAMPSYNVTSPAKVGNRHPGPRHTGHQDKTKLANARRLIQKIEVLSSEVLDSCEFCHRLQCLIKELQAVINDM